MLEVALLGQFAVRVGDRPVEITSRPAQTLLAHLLLTVGSRHRREKLAALLWPDADEENARQNLRNALWKLNKALGSGYIVADKLSAGFNPEAEIRLDTAVLEAAENGSAERLMEAVAAYKGELLPGFYDEWILLERERLQAVFERKMQALLGRLIEAGRLREVLEWAERWIALGQVPEPAYGALMSAHASLGDSAGVASVYRRCVRALEDELGVEPSPETQALYERLLKGEARHFPPPRQESEALQLPAFLVQSREESLKEAVIGRDEELARLEGFLNRALAGRGQLAFVMGEAGQGKTSLVGEFSRRAQEAHPELMVALGSCNAYTGIGDPYLPFREILAMLTGDVESRWLAGTITHDHALRLWQLLPAAIDALISQGAELLDGFVSADALAKRAAMAGLGKSSELRGLFSALPRAQDRSHLFEAYAGVVTALSRHNPLLLILDDLHWADPSSTSLLFHLGRRLEGGRVLMIGAYRPEDVSEDGSEPHPLGRVLGELERYFGDFWVDLDKSLSGRAFVDSLLDSEPNRLGRDFRDELARRTEGNPLFTVELLQEMKERGSLWREEGYWTSGPDLEWEALPARIEGVIRTRLGRLDSTLREALAIGSVEGESFSAEVAANILGTEARPLIRRLSNEADRRHRLVEEQGIRRLAKRRLSQYRFRHNLFQRYLYNSLGRLDRAYLHEEVGGALEALYGEEAEEIAVDLARHFHEAGLEEKAIHYLLQAGKRATLLSAHEEAVTHLSRALELFKNLPEMSEQRELELLLALGAPLQAIRGYSAREVGALYGRARALCERVGDIEQCFLATWNLWAYHAQHADLGIARELARELLALAERAEDRGLFLQAHHALWFTLLCLGDFAAARDHAKQGMALYEPAEHHVHAFLYGGHDPGSCGRLIAARALWHLGYPDEALRNCREALELAQRFSHPNTLAHAHIFTAEVHLLRREGRLAQEQAEATNALATKHGFAHWLAWGRILQGCALAEEGQVAAGIARLRQGVADYEAIGGKLERPVFLARLAEAHWKLGESVEGLAVVAEAFRAAEASGERRFEAELYRLKGELLLLQGDREGAQACLQQALEVARKQRAKCLELRVAMSLYRLWRQQGKGDEGRKRLLKVYGWFKEGLDTKDLLEAEALLNTPAQAKPY